MNKLVRLLLCCTFTLALSAPDHAAELTMAQMDTIADLRTAAINAYRKEETQTAANLYRQSIALGDSSIIPFYNLACCYGRLGEYDSCKTALKAALDRGYPDYMELGTDPDLQLLQQDKASFAELWQRAFNNSFGKVMAKLFDGMAKQAIIKQDTARLYLLLSPEKRTATVKGGLNQTLDEAGRMLSFAQLNTPEQLTSVGNLENRNLRYTNNHFVLYDEYSYQLPIGHFDPDFAQLLAYNKLHLHMHTVDHLYSYLDTLYLQKMELEHPKGKQLPTLTDSVLVLTLKSQGERIDDYQEKIGKDSKLCQQVLDMIKTATPISEKEFTALNPKNGDIRYARLNSLPVQKQFKGVKLAFYAGSKVAVVVIDDHYYFVKGKFKL